MASEATPTTALTTISSSSSAESEKFNYIQRLGKVLAASGYFADVRDQAQAIVKILAGEELGIEPIAAAMGIHIIKGKIVLGASLIASRIKAHGYDYTHERLDSTGCVLVFYSKVEGGTRRILGKSSFTEGDALKAGIKSEMYGKYPRNMFFSRAISNGARWFTPDIFAGSPVFTAEEVGAPVDEHGDQVMMDHPSAAAQDKMPDDFGERVAHFQKLKAKIGAEAYYRVLEANGYHHSNEVCRKDLDTQRRIYRELANQPDLADTAAEPPLPPKEKKNDDDTW